MQVGVFYFSVDYGIDPGELAAALEARDEILRLLDDYAPLTQAD